MKTNRNPGAFPNRLDRLVAIVLIGVVIACIVRQSPEDPRTIADKEGTYHPHLSLKDLALAMHQFQDRHGRLPPAALCSRNGTPLLSWRVLLLPELEQEELFRQFKLDEPWDSSHNLRLLPKMPTVFAPLEGRVPQKAHTTFFQVFVGKGTAFEECEGLRLTKDFPRRSYTILVVEGGEAVLWSKPEDIAYSETQPLPKLGAFFLGRFHAAMADGMVTSVRSDIDQARLRAAILRSSEGPGVCDE